METNLIPGLYQVTSRVNIRREPKIVDTIPHNRVGVLDIGTQRQVYSVVTDDKNQTWGRVSESDAAGIAQWICLYSVNRSYAKLIEAEPVDADRLAKLEAWARTQGYKG